MEKSEIEVGASKINWYHRIPLGHGFVTPGVDDTPLRLSRMGVPEDLRGKTVLDIGAWDGAFSFEAERRGAERVVATDSHAWIDIGKEGFEFARKALGSKVEDRDLDVIELSPETVGVFDLVLFLGVLYHMKDPLAGLERVASVTGSQLILSTAVDLMWLGRPAAVFYPGAELRNDPTNWWGPNPAAVEAMLRTVGFRRVRQHGSVHRQGMPPTFLGRVARAAKQRIRNQEPLLATLQQGSAIFHAWK